MSSELERRLEGFLREAPEPDPEIGERALARTVAALQPATTSHRPLRTAVLVFAALVVRLVVAAGSLAAAGALHVSFGKAHKQRPSVSQLVLPSGTNGIAVVVDGRLSVVTKSGFRLQGLPVTAAALSPHALYVAAGIGRSLVALEPDGKRAWSHPTGGTVIAIAWAPFGNRIAYIVHTGRHFVLHVIWGNGANDTLIDASVRAVRPSWRSDSLAFAYVGAGGRAIVYDLGHEDRKPVPVKAPVTGLAFSPAGDSLAVERSSDVWLLHQSSAVDIPAETVEAFGWRNGRLAVAGPALDSAEVREFAPDGARRGSQPFLGIVVAVTPELVVVRRGDALVAGDTQLLTVPRRATVSELEIG